MKFFLFTLIIFCRYVEIKPRTALSFKDRVKKDTTYKFIYNTFGARENKIELFDNFNRTIGIYHRSSGVVFVDQKYDGFITIKVYNPNNEIMKFGYRCPDVDKETQGALGPYKDKDSVAELLRVLEENVKSQKRQLENFEGHKKLVSKARNMISIFLFFEIILSGLIMWYTHSTTLKMFEKKHSGN